MMKEKQTRQGVVSAFRVTGRDIVFATGTLIVAFFAFSFYVKSSELKWKRHWMELVRQRSEAQQYSTCLELRVSCEGNRYEEFTIAKFIETVKACSSNLVNNVQYVGTSSDYDFFIHNSDFLTRRVRIRSNSLSQFQQFPLTDDASYWKIVTTCPETAVSDLESFFHVKVN